MLIADEPTTALDVTTQKQVLELLVRLHEGVAPRLLGDAERPLARADLRYTNGFALEWEGQA